MSAGHDDAPDPHVERRDTSWVQGELATDFAHFPRHGVTRTSLASRYYLTTPADFSHIVEDTVLGYRGYQYGRFDTETFALGLKTVVEQRHELNCVGLVLDGDGDPRCNVVVYEDGTTELIDPDSDPLVVRGDTPADNPVYAMEEGTILL